MFTNILTSIEHRTFFCEGIPVLSPSTVIWSACEASRSGLDEIWSRAAGSVGRAAASHRRSIYVSVGGEQLTLIGLSYVGHIVAVSVVPGHAGERECDHNSHIHHHL